MSVPMTLTCRRVTRSAALESRARELSERLQRFCTRITACHVTVEGAVDHAGNIAAYGAKFHVSVAGAQIHADSGQHRGAGQRDACMALRDAYENARRQLEDLNWHRAQWRNSEGALSRHKQ
jgi:hypothetical protein